MAITSNTGVKNYTIARGRVFFDRFPANAIITALTLGEGERYLGNTPGFAVNFSAESLEHFDADEGVKEKDDSVQLSTTRAGSFSTDNITGDNVAIALLGESANLSVTATTGLVDTFAMAVEGREYQLGMSEATPSGRRKLANVVVKNGAGFATTVPATDNYEVDLDLGRIYVLPGSALADATFQVEYDQTAHTRTHIISGSEAIYGAMRIISTTVKGEKLDYYLPYVKITPDGDMALKGDEWQTLNFTLEVLKKASNVDAIYCDGRPVA